MPAVDYAALAASSKGPDPVPEADYNLEVTGATYKESSNGKPMYVLEFSVSDGPYKGRKIWRNFTLSLENPNAVAAFFGQMRTLGADSEFFAAAQQTGEVEGHVCQRVMGAKVVGKDIHKEWNGRVSNDIKSIKSLPGGAGVPAVGTPGVLPVGNAPTVGVSVSNAPAPGAAPGLPPGLGGI